MGLLCYPGWDLLALSFHIRGHYPSQAAHACGHLPSPPSWELGERGLPRLALLLKATASGEGGQLLRGQGPHTVFPRLSH